MFYRSGVNVIQGNKYQFVHVNQETNCKLKKKKRKKKKTASEIHINNIDN